jgi:hypothetical protein
MRDRGERFRLGRRLERERPQPSDQFVAKLAQRVGLEPMRRRTGLRVALASGFTVALVAAFGVTGGISYAAKSVHGGTTAVTNLVTGVSVNAPASDPTSSNGNGNGHKPPGGPNPCPPSEHGVFDSHGTLVGCAHNGDASGNCGQNQSGNPGNGGDHGYGNSASNQYCQQVLVCDGNGADAHTISVDQSAVADLLAAGDQLGPCPSGT